jgi:hypothetical protein
MSCPRSNVPPSGRLPHNDADQATCLAGHQPRISSGNGLVDASPGSLHESRYCSLGRYGTIHRKSRRCCPSFDVGTTLGTDHRTSRAPRPPLVASRLTTQRAKAGDVAFRRWRSGTSSSARVEGTPPRFLLLARRAASNPFHLRCTKTTRPLEQRRSCCAAWRIPVPTVAYRSKVTRYRPTPLLHCSRSLPASSPLPAPC